MIQLKRQRTLPYHKSLILSLNKSTKYLQMTLHLQLQGKLSPGAPPIRETPIPTPPPAPATLGESIKVNIKTLSGKTWHMQLHTNDTYEQVKVKIKELTSLENFSVITMVKTWIFISRPRLWLNTMIDGSDLHIALHLRD